MTEHSKIFELSLNSGLSKILNTSPLYSKSSFINKKAILDILPYFIFWKDKQSTYLGCNKRFSELTEVPSGEISGKTDFDLNWGDGETEFYRECDRQTVKGKIIANQRETLIRPDGSKIIMLVNKIPLLDEKNNCIGVLGSSIDVTELNQFTYNEKMIFKKFGLNHNLSIREAECVYHTVRGMTAKQIARIMGLSNRTVESYLNNAKFKLNCKSKQELILKVFDYGAFNK